MRAAMLIDWMAGRDLVFHLRQIGVPERLATDPLLDPRYDNLVGYTMTDEERTQQTERLRRTARIA